MHNYQTGDAGAVYFGASAYNAANFWEFTITGNSASFGVFGGSSRKKATVGQQQITGTVRGKYDEDQPIEDLITTVGNTEVSLKLYYDDTNTRGWTIPCKITEFSPSLDGDTGAPLEWTISFVSHGAWTEPSHS